MNESTKRQIRELREYAKNRRGEIADICDRAADKIEELAEKIDLYLWISAYEGVSDGEKDRQDAQTIRRDTVTEMQGL